MAKKKSYQQTSEFWQGYHDGKNHRQVRKGDRNYIKGYNAGEKEWQDYNQYCRIMRKRQ